MLIYLLSTAIVLLNALYYLFFAAYFILVYLVFRPGRALLRFIFYKVAVKLYKYYFQIAKRIGLWNRDSSLLAFARSKATHVTVGIVTLAFVANNFTYSSKAQSIGKSAGKTVLASLVESEFGTLEEEELVEFFDQESVISPTQQSYLKNLSSLKPEPSATLHGEEAGEETADNTAITQEGGAIVKPDLIQTKETVQPREAIVQYEVQPGDTVSTIAQNFGVTVSTILWENDLSAYSLIRPGDKLSILPTSGITHKVARGDNLSEIAKKYDVEIARIMDANKLTDPSQVAIGDKLIIPGGKKPAYSPYQPASVSGYNIIRDLVEKAPIINRLTKPKSSPAAGNKMAWPTVGHRITQYFSWRHHAVDVANKIGTPIYAADAGTVEYVGWGQGYGNQVVINHGGGKKTRYAHLSKFYCRSGDSVAKGESIGAMGSTGWSTGSHLHFEVIINGEKYNPLNYIR